VPVYEWLFDRLGDMTKHVLSDFCKETDYFDRREVMRLIEDKRDPRVWYLLNFAMWWKATVA